MTVIHLERAGWPRLVVVSLLATLTLLLAMGYFLCRTRRRWKPRMRSPHTGFQKINTNEDFTDSEEDDIQFDK